MKREFRYGLITGTAMSLWVLAEFALGFHTTSPAIGVYSGYFSILVPAVIIFSALREQQQFRGGILTFREGITVGFTVSLIAAALFTLFMVFYNTSINPGWIDAMVEWQRRELILNGATDDQIGQFTEQHRRMNNTMGQAVMGFIGTTGLGVFLTLAELLFLRLFQQRSR
jgi:hypothetical protein